MPSYATSTVEQPSTYIPTPSRVLAIIQLCLAFTAAIWMACGPYVEEYLDVKSDLLLYQTIIGERVTENAIYFNELSVVEREKILRDYQQLQERAGRPFLEKVWKAFIKIFSHASLFKLIWIVLSVVIPVLLLKRREGAIEAVWLLPIFVLCYGFFSIHNVQTRNDDFIPSESWIVSQYLTEPLSKQIAVQQKQLLLGWQRYLVAEWAKEAAVDDEIGFQSQVRRGEFSFNLARLKRLDTKNDALSGWKGISKAEWIVYLAWNLFFACAVTWNLRKESRYLYRT